MKILENDGVWTYYGSNMVISTILNSLVVFPEVKYLVFEIWTCWIEFDGVSPLLLKSWRGWRKFGWSEFLVDILSAAQEPLLIAFQRVEVVVGIEGEEDVEKMEKVEWHGHQNCVLSQIVECSRVLFEGLNQSLWAIVGKIASMCKNCLVMVDWLVVRIGWRRRSRALIRQS